MHNKVLIFLLLLVSPNLWALAKIEHWRTAQGSRVYYVHTKALPMVDIRVAFDAGSARDGDQYGIAAMTSAVMNTAGGSWDTDEVARRFESVGANFNAGVSKDMAWVSLRSLNTENLLEKALATMQALLNEPTFSETDFAREKNRILTGIKAREESPSALANLAYYKALYGDHPYAYPASGFTETVSVFTRNDLRRFYQQYYVTANAIVVIVGDLSRQQAAQTADRLLSGLPGGSQPAALPKVVMPKQKLNEHVSFPSQQTHVLSGLPGMHRKDKDYFPLYVGNHILGGSGLVSLLFEEVREKRGLAYSAYSYLSPMLRKGPFTMGLQTRNDQASQAVGVLIKTLRNFVGNGPSEKQLIAAKKNISGGYAMRFDTNAKLTAHVAMIGFYQLPINYLETYPQKVQSVTREEIRNAFQRRINPDLLQTIMVGDDLAKSTQ